MSTEYIARATDLAARALGGEMMIMSARDSTLYTLNPLATAIWQAADGSTPLERIVEEKICAEYDVDPMEAAQDARSFVEELAGHGLLIVSDEPLGGVVQPSGGLR